MSAIRLTCPCGHTWEHTQAVTVPADLRLICPVCSPGATEAPPKPGTVLQSAEQSAASAAESVTGAPGVFVAGFESGFFVEVPDDVLFASTHHDPH